MRDAETRALRRALLLLVCVSAGRWLWGHREVSEFDLGGSILPELSDAVAEAASDEARRSRPLGEGERIDPNQAAAADLDRLPGVGPSIAAAIVSARTAGAVYRSQEDLDAVRGVGPALLVRIGPFLEFGSAQRSPAREGRDPRLEQPRVLDINRAGIAELVGLPGVGPAIAERIVHRRREQPFRTVDDLLEVKGIGPATLEKLRPAVGVGRRR